MKETKKQYLRLFILTAIITFVLFYQPISSGRFFKASEKLEIPLIITLDGINYAFSKDLTAAEFEKNGWVLLSSLNKEDEDIGIFNDLVQPGGSMFLTYLKLNPNTGSSRGNITVHIQNTSSEPLLYNQCECNGIKISEGLVRLSVYFPKGITLGDSYGRVKMAYSNVERLKTYHVPNPYTFDPNVEIVDTFYSFDISNYHIDLTFFRGRLRYFELQKFKELSDLIKAKRID